MKEENNIKLVAFKLNAVEQSIYYNYLIDNNIKNSKELINKFVIDNVMQRAYTNIQQLKELKQLK